MFNKQNKLAYPVTLHLWKRKALDSWKRICCLNIFFGFLTKVATSEIVHGQPFLFLKAPTRSPPSVPFPQCHVWRHESVFVLLTWTVLTTGCSSGPHSPTHTCGLSSRPLPLPTGPSASGPGPFWPESSPLLFLWAPAGTTAELLGLMAIWVPLNTACVVCWLQKRSTTVSVFKSPGSILANPRMMQQHFIYHPCTVGLSVVSKHQNMCEMPAGIKRRSFHTCGCDVWLC